MKKAFTILALFITSIVVSCTHFQENELQPQQSIENITGEYNYIYADIAEDETKTFVRNNIEVCWHAEDAISSFCFTTYNAEYTFTGNDGDRGGMFYGNSTGSGSSLNNFYAIYPYNANASIKSEGKISTTLPYVQNYVEDSFGKGTNLMAAVVDSSSKSLYFRNVCGFLKLKLYGNNVTIKSIVLHGNNGEKLSGTATISATHGAIPTIAMEDTANDTIMIYCENGVKIGTTADTATTFWVVLPPMTFQNGFTITAYTTDGRGFTQSTSNEIIITRNRIQPMKAVEVAELTNVATPFNQIWYTSNNGSVIIPDATYGFGANIISNTYENGQGVITFDGEITSIGHWAFRNCTSLTSVTIPDSVTSIGVEAFSNCTSLTSVTIPDSVTKIEGHAFMDCTSLTSVYISDLSAWCKIIFAINTPSSPLYYGAKLYLNGSELTDITIPSDITEIKDYTFRGCTSLTSVTIPDSVTSIGFQAFYKCTSLTSVKIGNGITLIGESAFFCCTSLKSATIPDSVTEIGVGAFEYCTSLTSITIPNSVTSIGYGAFYDCISLTEVCCKSTAPPTGGQHMFHKGIRNYWGEYVEVLIGCKIYVPAGSESKYKSAPYWSDYGNYIFGIIFTDDNESVN